jgi:XTP/dITP diphosphohydrolase
MKKNKIIYASWSEFKKEEIDIICEHVRFPRGQKIWSDKLVGDFIEFEFRRVEIKEILERDLVELVREKAKASYKQLQVPCLVEHGGLIFINTFDVSYPGGLTQPMWDALKADGFIRETHGAGRDTIARAVVGFCDGMTIKTYIGETRGILSDTPRGTREYYWDTIFIPSEGPQTPHNRTYSEMASVDKNGLIEKVSISQSTKAILNFLESRLEAGESTLFRNVY